MEALGNETGSGAVVGVKVASRRILIVVPCLRRSLRHAAKL